MRVTLEIIDGPEVGRLIRVGAKELRTFGRTDRADVSFPVDRGLSELHFALDTDGRLCRLRDLESTNGTRVNGEPVGEQILADGDKISAGHTTFRVRIEGGAARGDVTAAKVAVAAVPAAVIAQAALRKGALTYTAEDCQSGLRLYRGEAEKIGPAHVADVLARQMPAYLTVDWNKIEDDRPSDLPPPAYLFDWLPPEAAKSASPQILSYADYPGCFKLIESGWGSDALVCFIAKGESGDVLAHLRREAQGSGGSVVGIAWPSALAPMLTYSRPETALRMTRGVEAILVEFADFPDTWQIFARAEFQAVLQKAGFVEQAPTEAGATT